MISHTKKSLLEKKNLANPSNPKSRLFTIKVFKENCLIVVLSSSAAVIQIGKVVSKENNIH